MDVIEEIVEKIVDVCAVLGFPVDLDTPLDLDEADLPRVLVWTGREETVDEGNAKDWAEEADIYPVIEVLLDDDDVETVSSEVKSSWRTLRRSLRKTKWREFTSDGSVPSFAKTGLDVEDKPGISGYAVEMRFRVEYDDED